MVMLCVRSGSYELLLDGKRTGKIYPTRGIWQGDPLSLLLVHLLIYSSWKGWYKEGTLYFHIQFCWIHTLISSAVENSPTRIINIQDVKPSLIYGISVQSLSCALRHQLFEGKKQLSRCQFISESGRQDWAKLHLNMITITKTLRKWKRLFRIQRTLVNTHPSKAATE